MPPQDIPALREALDGTDFNAIRAGMVALRKLTPHSTDARDAATDLAETAASDRAAVPSGDTTIQRLPNGRYRVHDPATGEEIGQAPNRSAAVRMAQLAMEGLNPRLGGADQDDSSEVSGGANATAPIDTENATPGNQLDAESPATPSTSEAPSPSSPEGNPYRDAEGKLPITPYHRSATDPDLAEKEAEFNGILNSPIHQADAAYNAIPETHGGKVIGTDLAREVSPHYRTPEGRARYTGITTSTASQYSKDRLWREIHHRGNRRSLLFTAGGPASGKSTVVNHELIEEHDLIYDGTLRDKEWAKRNLEAASSHGWKSAIVWVGRPLKLAAVGAVERSIKEGRPFALADLPDAHYAAQQSAIALAKHFKGNPKMDFQFYFNEGTSRDIPAIELTLEQIDKGGQYSYDIINESDGRHLVGGEKASNSQSGLERFRAATREDIVGVFRDAVEGRITVDGKRASHDLLIQLAGKDEELQRILKESRK